MSVEQGRVNAQGFKIKYQVRVFIARGRRIESDAQVWISKAHPLRASVTENSQSRIVGSPICGFEEVDTSTALESPNCPGEVIPNAVIDPHSGS